MYTLHGHLGGVLLLATTGLGDTLFSVGVDRVAKVKPGHLQGSDLPGVEAARQTTRSDPVVPGLTAACLSSDSHLLLTTGSRLQEVEIQGETHSPNPTCQGGVKGATPAGSCCPSTGSPWVRPPLRSCHGAA